MVTEAEKRRKLAGGLPFAPTPPVADGVIDAADRAALAGVILPSGGVLSDGDADDSWRTFRDRYHPEKKMRSRYR